MPPAVLRTDRLVLRPWRAEDRAPFAALNADPAVMEHFPSTMTRAESDAFVDVIEARFAEQGWGLWAVEAPGTTPFAGFVGLSFPRLGPPFAPGMVEVGWRLDRPWWGRGWATEAATAALDHGFGVVGLDEVVSFTVPANVRSWTVMERLGLHHDPADDFDHPRVPDGPLRRHVLYRITADEWRARRRGGD